MKLNCEITAVENCGDTLRVKLQGKAPRGADWRPLSPQTFEIANTNGAARSFYVGRHIAITIEPK